MRVTPPRAPGADATREPSEARERARPASAFASSMNSALRKLMRDDSRAGEATESDESAESELDAEPREELRGDEAWPFAVDAGVPPVVIPPARWPSSSGGEAAEPGAGARDITGVFGLSRGAAVAVSVTGVTVVAAERADGLSSNLSPPALGAPTEPAPPPSLHETALDETAPGEAALTEPAPAPGVESEGELEVVAERSERTELSSAARTESAPRGGEAGEGRGEGSEHREGEAGARGRATDERGAVGSEGASSACAPDATIAGAWPVPSAQRLSADAGLVAGAILDVNDPGAAPHDAELEALDARWSLELRADDRATIRVTHPTLGEVSVDLRAEGGEVELEMTTEHAGAAIAMRSLEDALRGSFRARGTELRRMRVITRKRESGAGTIGGGR